jgi:hypothetical protein
MGNMHMFMKTWVSLKIGLKNFRNPDSLKSMSNQMPPFFNEGVEFEGRNISLMFWVTVLLRKGGEKRND